MGCALFFSKAPLFLEAALALTLAVALRLDGATGPSDPRRGSAFGWCRQVKELQLKYELKMKLLREDLELRRKVEILEIEERKNNHSKRTLLSSQPPGRA